MLVSQTVKGERFEYIVEEGEGQRLDVWLAGRGLPYSRSQLGRRIDEGEVTVDGRGVKSAHRVRRGEQIVFAPPAILAVEDLPEDIPLTILHEDAHLIVIDKPPGMVVHPATSHQGGTLVNALLHHCGASLKGVGGERRPGVVHRLDKDTSGVMVVAKDEPTLTALQVRFAAHDLERKYFALIEGVIADAGSFKTKHGRHPTDRKRFSSKVHAGRRAVTHWKVKERLKGATLVEVTLETGRTHQIRVHFSDHGHTVLGDPLYGRPPRDAHIKKVAAALGRQALHAAHLGVIHPATGQMLRCSADPPQDFQQALAALR